MIFQRRSGSENLRQTHQVNLQKRLASRLESARSRGDQALVRQLEAEANYLDSLI